MGRAARAASAFAPAGAALVLALAAPACSYTWSDLPPPPALVGDAPSLTGFTRLNRTTAGAVNLIRGDDGEVWAAFCEVWRQLAFGRNGGCTGMRLVRVTGPAADEFHQADQIVLRSTALYLLSDKPMAKSRQIVIHRAGRANDRSFLFPSGPARLQINDGGIDDTFAYWVIDEKTTTFSVRRDGHDGGIELPIPEDVKPTEPEKAQLYFSPTGDILAVRDGNGVVTAYSTSAAGPGWSLGKRPPSLALDLLDRTLLSIGDDGLRAITLDGKREAVLDPAAGIEPATLYLTDKHALYVRGGDLYRVRLNGAEPAELVQRTAARVLATARDGDLRFIYSRDPASRYVGGAGDGWLGESPLFERGAAASSTFERLPRFGAQNRKLYFLEHAARTGAIGELRMVDVPGDPREPVGAPAVLGINVRQFLELPDGRVLAVENHAFVGSWNRLVVIEAQSAAGGVRQAQWVAPATHEFRLLPGAKDVLVDAVSGASGYDIYRVPIPPPLP